MSIRRSVRPRDNFTLIRNEVFNSGLSMRAIGALTYLLSKPDHWTVSVAHLVSFFKDTSRPEGRDSVYAILDELRSKGYVVRTTVRDENGKMGGYDYEVFDTPTDTASAEPLPAKPTPAAPASSPDKPFPAQPETVLPALPYPAQPFPAQPTLVKTDKLVTTEKVETTDYSAFAESKSDLLGELIQPKPIKVAPGTPTDAEIAAAFKRFMAAFPSRAGRDEAERNFTLAAQGRLPPKGKQIRAGAVMPITHKPVPLEDMIRGAEGYAREIANRPAGSNLSIKHAQGWLTDRRWRDYEEGGAPAEPRTAAMVAIERRLQVDPVGFFGSDDEIERQMAALERGE